MSAVQQLLKQTKHRPFSMPQRNWRFYQEWNKLLFLHWEIDFELLRPHVPKSIDIDQIDGKCYVSFVAFTMNNIRPAYVPAMPGISDFHELNLRTYVTVNGEPGIYFISLEAGNKLSAFVSAKISGLAYQYSAITYSGNQFRAKNSERTFNATFLPHQVINQKTPLDRWLTERYRVYFERKGQIWKYDVHHLEWELKNVALSELKISNTLGDVDFSAQPNFAHYADGIKVIAWNKQPVKPR